MDYRARELAEITPRNSNDVEIDEPALVSELAQEIAMALVWEPSLKSELAQEIAMALVWEPSLKSELAQQCDAVVAIEATTPTLRSELGRCCAAFVEVEDFELKSALGRACAMEVDSEAGSSSDDESDDESEGGSSAEDEPNDAPTYSYLMRPKESAAANVPHGVASKLSSREATELARKRLLFA